MPHSSLVSLATARFAVLSLRDAVPQGETRPLFPAPASRAPPHRRQMRRIFLDIDEPYTRSIIHEALSKQGFEVTLGPGQGMEPVPMPADCQFQWAEYERIDWQRPGGTAASSYRIRKGLARKAQLALYINRYVAKHPDSRLRQCVPDTAVIDTWPAWEPDGSQPTLFGLAGGGAAPSSSNINQRELLEGCLAAARALMVADEEAVWILKGSTVNKGVGIYIVHVYEQVLDICWSEPSIREWVLQRYIASPLTLGGRKFHIRTYIVAVGALRVYFFTECLALLSATPYRSDDFRSLAAHITNTAYQANGLKFREEDLVLQWGSEAVVGMLVRDGTCTTKQEAHLCTDQVLQSMQDIVSELFAVYETEFGVFSPIDGCFEHFGLDFIVDSDWQVFLLEVNPGPDFKQTGSALKSVIEALMMSTIDAALVEHPTSEAQAATLKCVYDKVRRAKET